MTRVLPPRAGKTRVLVHQGALDWGFRYFTEALRTDPSFEFHTIVTPDVGLTLARSGAPGSATLGRLPDTAGPYAPFDCVVLAHPYPQRFSAAQQKALVDFVRNGGAVLFMSPDAEAMGQFADSPLQEILPVQLGAGTAPPAATPSPSPERGNIFARAVGAMRDNGPRDAKKLTAFLLTEAGRATPIFALGGGAGNYLLPRFTEYVPVFRTKPATEVLAVHPTMTDLGSGKPHILLATETFGRGRGVLLTTDALWRWKLNEPSDSRVVETFWQQLLLAIGRRKEPGALRFATSPAQVRVGHPTTLLLGGVASAKLPVVVARSPEGRTVPLTVRLTADADSPWSVEWTPDRPGAWELIAGVEDAYRASIFPSAVAEVVGELSRTPPALDLLRALAGETGGTLLTQEPPAAWRPEVKKEKAPEAVATERREPEWNTWNLLWLALGAYAAELVLRRLWKLL
jgi:hypothetical protein